MKRSKRLLPIPPSTDGNVNYSFEGATFGESHIVVTDKNGQFSTASSWAFRKVNTNAVKSSEDGVWFGTSEPDDSKGALLYDTYVIEELKCDSNAGFKLIPAFEVVVSRKKVTVDLGTLTDEYEKEITIHTTDTDKKTGEKMIVAGKDIKIVDKVTLDGLETGSHRKLHRDRSCVYRWCNGSLPRILPLLRWYRNQSMNRKHREQMSASAPIWSKTLLLSWKHSSNSIRQLQKKNLPIMSKTVCLLLFPATTYFRNW
ncbi:Uncharacterised protein [Clostridioides difficile]|nr:Uncharacterised protein [Clostridioides difficile]